MLTVPGAGHTDLYEQAQWKPFIDTFWVNATTLLESITCATVGVDAPQLQAETWSVFPNPNNGESIGIRFPEDLPSVDLAVYDLMGKQVQGFKGVSNQQPISLSTLPSGTYLLQINHPERKFELKRLIIQ